MPPGFIDSGPWRVGTCACIRACDIYVYCECTASAKLRASLHPIRPPCAQEGQRYARPRPSSPRTATVDLLLSPSSGLRVGVSGWLRCARLRYETGTLALHPSTTFSLQRACERARQQCSGSLHPPPGSSPNFHLSPLPKRSLLCSIVFLFWAVVCRRPLNFTQTAGPPGANNNIWALVFFSCSPQLVALLRLPPALFHSFT